MGLLMYKDIPYSGGGSDIEPNPSGTATEDLTKLGIDETIYDVVDNDAVHSDDVGVANGVAELDSNGKVPSAQLPTYPTVNNGTLTIKKNGTTIATFTANQSGNSNANISVPTQPSDIGAAAESDIESTKTTSGNPLTLTDAAPINAEKLEVVMEPKQDLHGQSYPYVGGAGKNKFDADTAYASYKQSDGSYRLTGSNVHGIYNYISSELVGKQLTFSAYIDCSKETSPNYIRIYAKVNGQNINGSNMGSGNKGFIKVTFTPQSTSDYFGFTYGNSGGNYFTMSELQLEEGSARTSFAPYTNICPISGYYSVSVESVGKNLFDKDSCVTQQGKSRNDDGDIITVSNDVGYTPSIVAVKPNKQCVLSGSLFNSNTPGRIYFLKNDNSWISRSGLISSTPHVFTTPSDCYGIQFQYAVATFNASTIQLEYSNQATSYEPYSSTSATIQFGQTVYSGTVDFTTGELVIDRASIVYDGSSDENWQKYNSGSASAYAMIIAISGIKQSTLKDISVLKSNYLQTVLSSDAWGNYDAFLSKIGSSDYIVCGIRTITSVSNWKTYLASNPLQICYKLAEPFTIQLTPQELKLLKGTNNLSTDGTSMTIGYQPDNVIGELKEDLQQHTEMEWLQVMFSGQQTDFKDIQLQDDSSIALRLILADLEVFKHRFMLFEIYRKQNDSITYTNASLMLSISSLVEATYGYNATLGFNNGVNANFNVRIIYFQGNYEIMAAIYTDAPSPLTNLYARARLVD